MNIPHLQLWIDDTLSPWLLCYRRITNLPGHCRSKAVAGSINRTNRNMLMLEW